MQDQLPRLNLVDAVRMQKLSSAQLHSKFEGNVLLWCVWATVAQLCISINLQSVVAEIHVRAIVVVCAVFQILCLLVVTADFSSYSWPLVQTNHGVV